MPVPLPSLDLLSRQVATERATMNGHAESLDTKAGVVLGFAGVLVGLGATAQATVSTTNVFRVGLGAAVLSGLLAVWAYFPRRFPVIESRELREKYLTAPKEETQLFLLDTQIEMIKEAAALIRQKGIRLRSSLVSLAGAAAFAVAGTLEATGGHHG
jgi:hypothetical protein